MSDITEAKRARAVCDSKLLQPATVKLPTYVAYVVEAICARRGVLVSDALGPCKTREASWARYEIWAALARGRAEGFDLHNPYSYAAVAKMFGRDHSSIQHGVRRLTGRLPIPSKRGRSLVTAQDPCPPAGHCMPPTPRQGLAPALRFRRQIVVPPPVTRTPEEIRVERNRRRREAKRRAPTCIRSRKMMKSNAQHESP
jgi:hypothetical protein